MVMRQQYQIDLGETVQMYGRLGQPNGVNARTEMDFITA